MIVGVPREIKQDEYRVAMLPVGVEELVQGGHRVLVETAAGQGSGIPDDEYLACGAEIVESCEQVWAEAGAVIKVKEPQPSEIEQLRSGQLLMTYFHFAADEGLTPGVMESGATASPLGSLRPKVRAMP